MGKTEKQACHAYVVCMRLSIVCLTCALPLALIQNRINSIRKWKCFTLISLPLYSVYFFVIIPLNQDDFLPRTATPLEDIFKSLFWYSHASFFFVYIFNTLTTNRLLKWILCHRERPTMFHFLFSIFFLKENCLWNLKSRYRLNWDGPLQYVWLIDQRSCTCLARDFFDMWGHIYVANEFSVFF